MLKEKSMLTPRNVMELQFLQEDNEEMKSAREVSEMLGVSKRTLQYYNEIGLVKPSKIEDSTGYWKYGARKVERLKEVMVLRELGYTLKEIKKALSTVDFDLQESLDGKIAGLEQEREAIGERIKLARKVKACGREGLRYMWEELDSQK